MIDAELVGFWDTRPYDYGVMESSSLVLKADGTGWTEWSNAARAMSVSRFTWDCPRAGTLELRFTTIISGSWAPGQAGLASIEDHRSDDTVLRTTYAIDRDSTDMVDSDFAAIHFGQPIEFSHDYGLVRRDIHAGDDPEA
ncbi:hypothetical protein O7635_14025 [Asanoa sp. WMMD1127]|uniref:hypothetical protein n=1 Tax=Asanoa sp. WMMD1127 TaxID=3016107 RepID=UPI002415F297|nr:hypothetical protein [Asanoa sp. WMMD1127]MDG4822967.1 hypothetical protein [Asanoa sp. WMMD1127]